MVKHKERKCTEPVGSAGVKDRGWVEGVGGPESGHMNDEREGGGGHSTEIVQGRSRLKKKSHCTQWVAWLCTLEMRTPAYEDITAGALT